MDEVPFRCPICGGTKYETKIANYGKRSEKVDYFSCKGCSVMFRDPSAFSHALDEKK